MAVVVSIASGAGRASTTALRLAKPHTLLTTPGQIDFFAQDRNRIAWAADCLVRVRSISGRGPGAKTLGCVGGNSENPHAGPIRALALGGGRLLWYTTGFGMPDLYDSVHTWAAGERRAAAVTDEFGSDYRYGGTFVTSVAADGNTHVFGTVTLRPPDYCGVEGRNSRIPGCSSLLLTGGRAYRVNRRSIANRLEIPPVALAVDRDRLAILPMTAKGCACNRDPSWSPDGTRIAIASRRKGPDTEIALVPSSGGAIVSLTDDLIYERQPDWSPDGASLVYVKGDDSLEVIGVDGSNAHQLIRCRQGCGSPAWSPDGSRIAFFDGATITVVDSNGSGRIALATGYSPAWSPDGKMIVFVKANGLRSELWLMSSDGSNQRKLADGSSPTWSTAGIAFERIDVQGFDESAIEIYAIRPDGSGLRQLTDNRLRDYSPDWSPDGARLAFIREAPTQEVYVMDADGTGARRVTDTQPLSTRFPVEVRTAKEGALVSRFMPSGAGLGIALSSRFAAVLTRQGRAKHIELFDPTSGASRGFVRVPQRTDAGISIAGSTLVFRTGRTIRLLDARRRRTSVLTVARGRPIGLSIEGRRVAWAERGKKRSRIRTVALSRG